MKEMAETLFSAESAQAPAGAQFEEMARWTMSKESVLGLETAELPPVDIKDVVVMTGDFHGGGKFA